MHCTRESESFKNGKDLDGPESSAEDNSNTKRISHLQFCQKKSKCKRYVFSTIESSSEMC